MKECIIDKILSTSGCLPPRNEDEMVAFEKVYSKVVVKENFHVDTDKIVSGVFPIKTITRPFRNVTPEVASMRIAARNFDSLPKEVVEKIKDQHNKEND
ncbi:MAG: hypothetical protein KBS94_04855 [Prevotella sp.]|nr:hypothetical protein [Candidatus Equicola faecalis]